MIHMHIKTVQHVFMYITKNMHDDQEQLSPFEKKLLLFSSMKGEDVHISYNGCLDAFTGIAVFMGKSSYIFWIYCVTDRET